MNHPVQAVSLCRTYPYPCTLRIFVIFRQEYTVLWGRVAGVQERKQRAVAVLCDDMQEAYIYINRDTDWAGGRWLQVSDSSLRAPTPAHIHVFSCKRERDRERNWCAAVGRHALYAGGVYLG